MSLKRLAAAGAAALFALLNVHCGSGSSGKSSSPAVSAASSSDNSPDPDPAPAPAAPYAALAGDWLITWHSTQNNDESAGITHVEPDGRITGDSTGVSVIESGQITSLDSATGVFQGWVVETDSETGTQQCNFMGTLALQGASPAAGDTVAGDWDEPDIGDAGTFSGVRQ